MLIALLAGLLTSSTLLLATAVQRTTPSHSRCPACTAVTVPVRPGSPAWRLLARTLTWRWCAHCGWEGVARRGPGLRGRGPVAHDSGFRWGANRTRTDPGFRWSPGPEARRRRPSGRRAHLSGFRWAGDAERSTPRPDAADGASAFRWGDSDPARHAPRGTGRALHPSDFEFASGPSSPTGGPRPGEFRFRDDGTSADPASAFRWRPPPGR